jgi:hypothetical protein
MLTNLVVTYVVTSTIMIVSLLLLDFIHHLSVFRSQNFNWDLFNQEAQQSSPLSFHRPNETEVETSSEKLQLIECLRADAFCRNAIHVNITT